MATPQAVSHDGVAARVVAVALADVAPGLAQALGETYAFELGEPEGTVKSRIRSGLRRLRFDLANELR